MEPFPSFGGAIFSPRSRKVIRLILKGCANRPFFHISVQEFTKEPKEPVIEQIGNYDPLPNNHNEKLVAINFQRLEHWLREGAVATEPVQKLLGLCGYFPVHPLSMKDAFERRFQLLKEIEKLKIEAAKFQEDTCNDKPLESQSSASLEEPPCTSATEEQNISGAEPIQDSHNKDLKSKIQKLYEK